MDDHADLAKRTYLTLAQLATYLGDWTIPKVRGWLARHPDVRRTREGKCVIVWRRDVDHTLATHAAEQAKRRRREWEPIGSAEGKTRIS